ncbi:MAG: protein tyrosine phosphatase [Alphaproteobacteria bacterium]|nr:protein tyrosine phosphatase [Alphaproteobacteria bacterium]
MSNIYVCALSRLEETVEQTSARYLVSAINPWSIPRTPKGVDAANHLRLAINDIEAPHGDLVHPEPHHIEKLIDFAEYWNKDGPLVVHCLAGISRSTASAYIIACALNRDVAESTIAQTLRRASTSARPNALMIELADTLLGRDGRMIAAIETLSPGAATMEADTFLLPSCF